MRASIVNILLLSFCICIATNVVGQKRIYNKIKDKKFTSGVINFDDGSKRSCDLFFDWATGIIYEKSGQGPLPHTAIKVVSFEFFDKEAEGLRRFYSLPYEAAEVGFGKGFTFFEVLYEKNNLAVLKFHYEEYKGETVTNGSVARPFEKVTQVYDKIFLVRGNSGLKCLMERDWQSREGQLLNFWDEPNTFRKLNQNVLEEIFADDYNELIQYIDKNDLKAKKVDDLIHAIKHYKENS